MFWVVLSSYCPSLSLVVSFPLISEIKKNKIIRFVTNVVTVVDFHGEAGKNSIDLYIQINILKEFFVIL